MKKLALILSLLTAFVGTILVLTHSSESIEANNAVFSEQTLSFLRQAQSEIFNEDWEGFNTLVENSQSVPSGFVCLMRAAQLQAESFSREERFAEKWMSDNLDSANAYFNSELAFASRADSARLLYCLGITETHRALWEAKYGSFLGAIKQGYGAREYYATGLELDSSFTENSIGLGAFLYWKSAKAGGALRSLGVVSDERDYGLQMLREAIPNSHISPDAGKSSLIWILLHNKQYQEAAEIATELSEKYPEGSPFLWPLARACKESHKYQCAIDTYLKLREILLRDLGNQINLIKVDYEITLLARILEDDQTLALIGRSFEEYSKQTPRKTRRELDFEFRALRRL